MSSALGDQIAREAVSALSDPGYVAVPGHCQEFVHEVWYAVPGAKEIMAEYRRGTAKDTMNSFRLTPFDIWQPGDRLPELLAGDTFYKGSLTSGPEGHTGIGFHNIIEGEVVYCIAENSSWQARHPERAIQGAKGWRTLDEWGAFEMIVRAA